MLLTDRQRRILKIVAESTVGVHTNGIAGKLGSSDGLKSELHELVSKKLLVCERLKNRNYYALTDAGKKEVETALRASIADSYATLMRIAPDLEKIASGLLSVNGPFREILDDRGIVKELYHTNPKTKKLERLQ